MLDVVRKEAEGCDCLQGFQASRLARYEQPSASALLVFSVSVNLSLSSPPNLRDSRECIILALKPT